MPRVPLLGGAYSTPGLIASAQRAVNLYPERNPQESQAPVSVTHYQRPGLVRVGTPPAAGRGRCLFAASNGDLFAVIDLNIFYIDPDFVFHNIGALLTPASTPVRAADNGISAIVVDGDPSGNTIRLSDHVVNVIGDPNFVGGTNVDFLDGFLVLNEPGTPNFYCTLAYSTTFNALYFGTKSGWPDNVQTVLANNRELWILGRVKSDVWFNSGTVPFPFETQPGVIVEHGCVAPYSAAKMDQFIYWLSQSPEGARMVMKNNQHSAERISTHAIEAELLTYPRVDDAIGSVVQIRGHNFYKLHFPTADRTWVYDEATKQWHEEAWYDINGVQHRAKAAFNAYAYGKNLALDWADGTLYHVDENAYADGDDPIVCIRSMPHILDDEDFTRCTYWKLIADIETGTGPETLPDQSGTVSPPTISMRISRNRGRSFDDARTMPLGAAGLYRTTPTWNRLGYARDAVFELMWAVAQEAPLDGVFIEFEKHEADI